MNPQSLCEAALAAFQNNSPFVLVTMMDQSGSVPRTAGARMLVRPDGSIWGTVGGGRYEAEAITLAGRLLRLWTTEQEATGTQPGAVLEYSLRGVTDMDMICGGTLSLLLEVLPPDARSRELFSAALEAERGYRPFVFVSRFIRQEERDLTGPELAAPGEVPIEQGAAHAARVERHIYLPESGRLVPAKADLPPSLLTAAASLNSPTPHHLLKSGSDYLLELFDRPFRIIIFGGGHVSLELAKMAAGVDFPVTVLDDRAEFANQERFPNAVVITPPGLGEEQAAACLATLHVGPRDGIVIVTRGHAHDRDALAASLSTRAGYIGMIGSKSKRTAVYNSMMDKGFSKERIDFVHSPIGLSIGADSPQEIAVSIAGELIQWRKNARDARDAASQSPELCKSMGCAKQ